MIKSKIWSRVTSRESIYASFFPLVRTSIVLLLAAGSGILLIERQYTELCVKAESGILNW
jgi:hypothetical protein